MTLSVHVVAEAGRLPLSRRRVAELARHVLRAERTHDAMLSITFLPRRAMAALNARHLGHRGATDVISFGFAPAGDRAPVVGDIYISPDVARENARRHGVGVREELARLVVHGTLHVLGYDHPGGEARTASAMWERQERLLASALRDGA
jgi:probable rRNA maturation factor